MVQSTQVSDYQCWKPCQCCHLLQVSSTWRGSTDSYGIDVPTRMTAVVGATGSSAISSSTSASSRQQQQQQCHLVADCSLRPRRHHSRYSRHVHHAHGHQQATRAKTSSVSTSAKSVSTIRGSRCCAPSSQCCCVMQSSLACVEHCSDTITTSLSSSNTRTSHSKPQSTPRVKNARNVFEVFSYGTRSKTREVEEIERAEENRGIKVVDGSTGLHRGVIIVHKSDNDIVSVEKATTSDVSHVISGNANCTTISEKGSEGNGYVVSERDAEDPLPIDGSYNWPFKIPSAPARPVKRSFSAISTTTRDAREGGEPTAAKKLRITSNYSTNTFTDTVSDDNSDADIIVIGETKAETAQTSKGRARLKETQLDYWRRTHRERGESNISMPVVKLVRFPIKQSMTIVTIDPEVSQRTNAAEITRNTVLGVNLNKKDTMTETSVQTAVNLATPSDIKIVCPPNMNKDNDSNDDIVYLKTTMKTVNADAHTSRDKYRESSTNDKTSPADDTTDSVLLLDVNNNNADTGGERVVEVRKGGNPSKIQVKFKCDDTRTVSENVVDVSYKGGDDDMVDGVVDDHIYDVRSDIDGVEDDDSYIDDDSNDGDDDGGDDTGSDEDAQEDDDDDLLLLAEDLFEPTRHQLSKAFQERYHRALDDDDGRGDFFYDSGEDFTLSGAEDSDDADDEIEELEESANKKRALPVDILDTDPTSGIIKESAIEKSLKFSEQENEYESTSPQNQERETNFARTLCSLGDTERRCQEVEQLETIVGSEPINSSFHNRNTKKIGQSNSITPLAEAVNRKPTEVETTGAQPSGSYSDQGNSGRSGFSKSSLDVMRNPKNSIDSSVTPQGSVSMPNGSPNDATKGASHPPRMTRPHVTTVAFLPDPDRAYCRLSWDTGPGVLIPLQSLFRVSRQCIPFVRDAGLHALSIPHDVASITEVANTATTDFYSRPICQSKIFSFKDSNESGNARDQEPTNNIRDDNSERREPAHKDAEDINHEIDECLKPSHCDDSIISIDDSRCSGCGTGRTNNERNHEETTKKMLDIYCVGFENDNKNSSSNDDCIIVDTRTGEPETSKPLEPDKIEKKQNSVEKPASQEPVDIEASDKQRVLADCWTTSGNNETHVPEEARSEETNSDLVRCTGESEGIGTTADSSGVSPTSLIPENTGSKSCVLFSVNKQQPVDADLCSVIDITEDLSNEASAVEGSREGNGNGVEEGHENHSRNTGEFKAGLFLPTKELWGRDIKAEVLGEAWTYSDGQCDILDISFDGDSCKTSYDSTILDLSTNQEEVDDTNGPIKDNHFSTNNVASSGCRDTKTSISSTNYRAIVSSVAGVSDPPGFSLAAPVQVDLSTDQ